jgi:hypothetical protein
MTQQAIPDIAKTPSTAAADQLAAKLRALESALDNAVRGARRRNMLSILISLFALVAIGYWLWYAHGRFSREATPETFAGAASGQLHDYMPAASLELEKQLKERAPDMVEQGVKRLRAAPDQFADQLNSEAAKRMDADMPKLENALYEHLAVTVKQARATADEANPKGTDEQKFKAMLDALAVTYEQESTKLLTNAYDTYTSHAREILAYLEHLADGKNLDRRDELHRDLVRSVLGLLAQHKDKTADTTSAQ